MLMMKPQCERCSGALAADAQACICSYECTFCLTCSSAMAMVCPNCQGELVARPRRARGLATAVTRGDPGAGKP